MTELGELKKRIISLASAPENNFLKLAKCLHELRRDFDVADFNSVLDTSGLGSRKAYYLIEIDKCCEQLRLPQSRLGSIGWTKLQIIGPHINAQNATKLLTLAEENTAHRLKLRLSGMKKKLKGKDHCVLMYFSREEYRKFEAVVLRHGGRRSGRGLINKEQAIMKAIKPHSRTK